MTIWQIAGGDSGARNYTKLFLDHDVMLIGPGDPGSFSEDTKELYLKNDPNMGHQIRLFCEEPKSGDVVLLRHGHTVVAVGTIPEKDNEYQYLNQFDDVLGWDLQHARRVIWDTSSTLSLLAHMQPVFNNYKSQRTFTRVNEQRLTGLEQQLRASIPARALKPLPSNISIPLTQNDLGMSLFKSGLSNEAVEHVLSTIAKIVRLDAWYESVQMKGRPTEHEIVAHMITPLMLGMGWSEQLVAIEWNKIDMAFFRSAPQPGSQPHEECVMDLEAKRPDQSLQDAYKQAKNYVKNNNLKHCLRIVTTDGVRILLYKFDRSCGDWPEVPSGYVNLRRIREKNVFPVNTSGVDTLMELVPWKAVL
ncbi:hypothetical protein JI721_03165 [Alicyclobacillus cycloheptanicus]|uniref:Restriction endonuclease n=1 Tax=Alicyclobacillus cycloheptanicus TaxID=1457 RepID=A0ABT9XNH8_9BACL|nr:hypothetical protein [Alicyclobacillus cycloheptanicus]MDQ0191599.1 hypothetical protein [Alicyclobacillus cycloheptanicus]WDM01861.1 hypothetical protein JI721_03165 [Alicyclobacillus cycloheptanicus]